MKKLFILLFVFAAVISTMFITGCNDSGTANKVKELAVKLVPLGEKAASKYLDKLVTDGKITEYQKEKIVNIYKKIKAKKLNKPETASPVAPAETAKESETASKKETTAAAEIKD